MNSVDSARTSNDLLRSLLMARAFCLHNRLADRLVRAEEALRQENASGALGALDGVNEDLIELHTFLKLARDQQRD
jgi:hypothetical protein